MTVLALAQTLGLSAASKSADRPVTGVYCCDLLSVVMSHAPADCAWVTVIGNVNAVAVATLADVSCVVLAVGGCFDEAACKAAEGRVTLLHSPLPVYETAVGIGALL
ncbi:MAG: hypothetical protein RR320_01575 [Oscillospiraceae bacterium]